MDILLALNDIPGIGPLIPYAALIVTIASAVATVLPAPPPDAGIVWRVAYAVVHALAINKGKAKPGGAG